MELRPEDIVALPFIGEFNVRQMLRKLGYTFDSSDLSCFKVECFGLIAAAYQERETEKSKAKTPAKAVRHRT